MAKVVQCPCGAAVRGETDDELYENVKRHAKDVHNQDVTREQALAMAQPE